METGNTGENFAVRVKDDLRGEPRDGGEEDTTDVYQLLPITR
jgi:hypothetical protein